jgi:MoaA/NifB/PqqE/SkfB family radical SAM enzyme
VYYHPIQQNYNTPDPRWFDSSANWPRDPSRAVAVVERLVQLKRASLPIQNGYKQLQAMIIPYFRNPDASKVAIKGQTAHERRQVCAALSNLQIQANGDVRNCLHQPAVGNIKSESIRSIWESRPHWWEDRGCLLRRLSPAERAARSIRDLLEMSESVKDEAAGLLCGAHRSTL